MSDRTSLTRHSRIRHLFTTGKLAQTFLCFTVLLESKGLSTLCPTALALFVPSNVETAASAEKVQPGICALLCLAG
jgi:hypothetical protein